MVCPYIYINLRSDVSSFFPVFCGSTKVTKGRESSDGRLTKAKNCSVSRKKTCLLSVAFAFLNAIFLFLAFLFVCLYFQLRIWLSVCNTIFITTFICLRTYFHWHFEVLVLTCILVSVIPHHTTFAFYGDGEPTQTRLERLSRLT